MRVISIFIWLLTFASAFAERTAWKPEKTWVFAVGILRFEGAALHGWPEEGRMDVVMRSTPCASAGCSAGLTFCS